KDLAALFIVFGAALFQFLGRIPLLEPDEGRYAEIPREMLERADFVTPYLNHVKYFEKPPLLYWLNSLSLSVFGQNEFAARFFPALCGLAGILLTYFIGRKIYGRREGLLAAIILGTSVGYLAQARMNIIDMPLTFCMTATLGFFLLAAREGEKRSVLYFYLFYLSAALTVLAKGLIGIVLPGAIVFLYLVVTRRWRILREMKPVAGGILFLVVAAPWFVLVSVRNPEFARFFFIHEHFERYLTKVHGHYQPTWYYIPVLLGCMFPWSLYLPSVFRGIWRERSEGKFAPTIFLAIWASVIFGFFSLSDSKLIPYIIPVFPAAALLLGRTFAAVMDDGTGTIRQYARVATVFILVTAVGLLLYPAVADNGKVDTRLFVVLGPILLAGGTASLLCLRRNSGRALFTALAGMSLLVSLAGPPFVFGRLAERKAAPELARIV
ncbi:MAG TPA: glycosyltransferase family 39 protein, partial [Candidatus Sulfotelmatobacter sp.]|nr:glycosyltransferase family 39 protein [Candidatus Sulfotelmatobacter sp.]